MSDVNYKHLPLLSTVVYNRLEMHRLVMFLVQNFNQIYID